MNPNNSWGFFVIRHIYIKNISMILSVWKPIYSKSKIINYMLVDTSEINDLKGKTGYVVIWKCDNDECKYKNKIHSIRASHLKKPKMCLDIQICRPCQCTGEGNGRYGDKRTWEDLHDDNKVNELKLFMSNKWKGELNPSKRNDVKIKKKQTIIDSDQINKILNDKNFKLIKLDKLEGKKSKFTIECPNGHVCQKTYLNFIRKDKKFICQKCFYDSISLNLTDDEYKIIDNYKKKVRSLTSKNYKLYKDIINPNEYKIDKNDYHLDHKYSIYEGFKNNVDPLIMASKENLEVIPSKINLSKQNRCSISLDELFKLTEYLFKKQ